MSAASELRRRAVQAQIRQVKFQIKSLEKRDQYFAADMLRVTLRVQEGHLKKLEGSA